MVDSLNKEQRSRHMGLIRQANTSPEVAVRKLAHKLGYRFRIGGKGLPGRPDIVFPGRKAVIFVHGCFWHRHEGCRRTTAPKTNEEFWAAKFARNVERDHGPLKSLSSLGWRTLVIWECETMHREEVAGRLMAFLGPVGQPKKEELSN